MACSATPESAASGLPHVVQNRDGGSLEAPHAGHTRTLGSAATGFCEDASSSRLAPQLVQNRDDGSLEAPHAGHTRTSGRAACFGAGASACAAVGFEADSSGCTAEGSWLCASAWLRLAPQPVQNLSPSSFHRPQIMQYFIVVPSFPAPSSCTYLFAHTVQDELDAISVYRCANTRTRRRNR